MRYKNIIGNSGFLKLHCRNRSSRYNYFGNSYYGWLGEPTCLIPTTYNSILLICHNYITILIVTYQRNQTLRYINLVIA